MGHSFLLPPNSPEQQQLGGDKVAVTADLQIYTQLVVVLETLSAFFYFRFLKEII